MRVVGICMLAVASCGRLDFELVNPPVTEPDAEAPPTLPDALERDSAPPDMPDRGSSADTIPGSGEPPRDAMQSPDVTTDARPPMPDDAAVVFFPSCNPLLVWHADFSVDPATQDRNGDGVADWAWQRSPPSPPGRFRDGIWNADGFEILDTRPSHDFGTRTLLSARMQNLTVDLTQGFAMGALVWLNLDNHLPRIVAVFVSLIAVPGAGQTLRLGAAGQDGFLLEVPRLPDRLLDIALDANPRTLTVELWIDGSSRGRFALPRAPQNPRDAFATVGTFRGSSRFDDVRITSCAP